MIIDKLQAAARALTRKKIAAPTPAPSMTEEPHPPVPGEAAVDSVSREPPPDPPPSGGARHRRLVIATPEEAAKIVSSPDDEAAQRAVAKARTRTAKRLTAKSGRIPSRKPGGTRGKSSPRRTAVDRLDDPPPETGAALIARVSRAVERELNQIEIIVGGHHVKPSQRTEAERRARTLASLARTLGELRRLRAGEQKAKPDDDDMPRDLDEFRRELSRRLEQVVRGREAAAPEGNE
ncbi:MAG: hypothetical protein ACOY4O_12265 [Pseudomonadota bacterium]|jgi:hypothetical protein